MNLQFNFLRTFRSLCFSCSQTQSAEQRSQLEPHRCASFPTKVQKQSNGGKDGLFNNRTGKMDSSRQTTKKHREMDPNLKRMRRKDTDQVRIICKTALKNDLHTMY